MIFFLSEAGVVHIRLLGAVCGFRIRLHGPTTCVGLASPRWCTDRPCVQKLLSETLGTRHPVSSLVFCGASRDLQGHFPHPFPSMQDCTNYILEIPFAFYKAQEINPTTSESFPKLRVAQFFCFCFFL